MEKLNQMNINSPEKKEEILRLEYSQSVEDIDISKWYKILYDPGHEFEIPLKFVSIKRRGPDYYGDDETWTDRNGNLYHVLRTDFGRKMPKSMDEIRKERKEIFKKES